jgi:hypothetical protein
LLETSGGISHVPKQNKTKTTTKEEMVNMVVKGQKLIREHQCGNSMIVELDYKLVDLSNYLLWI